MNILEIYFCDIGTSNDFLHNIKWFDDLQLFVFEKKSKG
jgi:hypothetical protein